MEHSSYVSQLSSKERVLSFEYKSTVHNDARLGRINTLHGIIETPAFIFCGTRAAIKGLSVDSMRQANTQIILSNTYHLMLKPGGDHIERMGGIQKFTGWNGPMLTDSGGFQAFSLNNSASNVPELKRKYSGITSDSGITRISEEGIICKSYYDGDDFFLSPEKAMEVQCQLGADLIVVLDECTPYSSNLIYNRLALERNHRWAIRSLEYGNLYKKPWQGIYGIVHGGTFSELRKSSAKFIGEQDFFGNAIGGSLGRCANEMKDVVGYSIEYLDKEKPVHLLGVGRISDIFMGVTLGVDTFDCVHPTRIARHGGALVKKRYRSSDTDTEYINLRNFKYRNDDSPIENDCMCSTCKNHSRGYLNYLLSIKESVVYSLITYHNVYFMNNLMENIRDSLHDGSIDDLKHLYL